MFNSLVRVLNCLLMADKCRYPEGNLFKPVKVNIEAL